MPRRFYVRTYGCQMNEHDSERIAGLLAAEGMEPTDDLDDGRRRRAQHLLHPGERRQQALRPPRRLKALKDGRPGPPDRGGRLPGPEGPRADRRAGRPRRRRVRHPQPGPRAPTLLERARLEGPIVEILEEHEAYPSALPARRERRPLGLGHDPDRLRQLVRLLHRADRARRRGQPPHGRHRPRGRGARRRRRASRSRCSARTSTPTGATSAPGSTARSSPTCCARSTRSTASDRIRFTSPHPKDLRPETIAAMAECASVCEHLHLPLQSGSDRTLARMHRGYTAERYLDAARGGPCRDPRPRGHHRHHRRLPRRDRRRLRAHARGRRRRAATTPPTRSCSRPVPGTDGGRAWSTTSSPPRSRGAHDAPDRRGRARTRWPRTRRGSGASRRCWSRARRRRTRRCWSGRTRQNKLVHFAAPDGAALRAGGTSPTSRSPTRAPHWLRGELRRRRAAPAAPRACASRIPVDGRGLRLDPSHLALVGPTASGKSALALDVAPTRSATSRSCRSTRCRSTGASTSAPPSRRAAEQAAVPHHLVDVADPREEWSVARVPGRGARRDRRHRGARASARCSSAAPGSTCTRSSTTLDVPAARTSRCGPSSTPSAAEPDGLRPRYAELAARRPGRRRRASSPTTAAASCGRSR